jgi:hypothetical protein
MKLQYLLVLGLLAIGCKNGEALAPTTANNPPPAPVATATPEPTFGQCAEAGWNTTKAAGKSAYAAGLKAYQDWKAAHPDTEESEDEKTSEP